MAPPKKVTPEMIAQVRTKVLQMYEAEKDMYEESDIQRLKTEDLLIQRYLTREEFDPLAAIECINGAFRFGKRQGISKITEAEFTPELLSLCQFQGKDKNGDRCVFFRYKTLKKIVKRNSKDQDKIKRLALYYFKKIEEETKGKNTVVIDARSLAIRDLVKYANKDIAELGGWLAKNAVKYGPDQVGNLYVYEVPRFFAAIGERLIKIIPDQYAGQIKLLRKKDIEKYISKDNLPDYMGGSLSAGVKGVPEEDDSGDEGDVTNLEDIEKALDETKM